jgi:ribosomal protein S18 acetylase RimI-like enzyme
MKEAIKYRFAVPEDAGKLSVLFKQVYIHTYGLEGVSDEFANFVNKRFSVAYLENSIRSEPNHIWVATYKNNLIGVAEISEQSMCPIRNIQEAELSKLYVLHHFKGMGVGHTLLQKAEQTLQEKNHDSLWLVVWEENPHAIAFYERQGYQTLGQTPFPMETNTYVNRVMRKPMAVSF